MNTTYENRNYTLTRADGTVLTLTANEVSLLATQMHKHDLRISIEDRVKEADGDTIDMNRYPYSYEEFIDEIYIDLEEEIDYGNPVSEEDIDEKITDTADFYEMLMD